MDKQTRQLLDLLRQEIDFLDTRLGGLKKLVVSLEQQLGASPSSVSPEGAPLRTPAPGPEEPDLLTSSFRALSGQRLDEDSTLPEETEPAAPPSARELAEMGVTEDSPGQEEPDPESGVEPVDFQEIMAGPVAEAAFARLTISSKEDNELNLKSALELEDVIRDSRQPDALRLFAVEKLVERAGAKALSCLVESIEDCRGDQLLCRVLTLVGEFGHRDQIPILANYLFHPVSRIRATAVEALEAIGDFECLEHLHPLLTDPDRRVRTNAAKAMGRFGQSTSLTVLTALIESPDPANRRAALYAARFLRLPEVEDIFERGLKDPELEVQLRTLEVLTSLPTPRCRKGVETLAGQTVLDEEIREACQAYFEKFPVSKPRLP